MTRGQRINTEELIERYAAGERNFAGIQLKSTGQKRLIEDADLTGINLSGASLSRVTFNNVVLQNSWMQGAFMAESFFNLVDMSGADLTGVTLAGSHMNSSSLVGAFMSFANLRSATFINVDMDAILLEQANLTRTNLSKINTYAGHFYELFQLRADGAILWDTTLPSGKKIAGPVLYDRFDADHRRDIV